MIKHDDQYRCVDTIHVLEPRDLSCKCGAVTPPGDFLRDEILLDA